MKKEIRQNLLEIAEADYQTFSSSLLPDIDNVLGVRLPKLRKLAKEIYASENWQEYLAVNETIYMEEVMLQGMIIGLIKDTPDVILRYVKEFIPKINNWSVCDCFCNGLKFTRQNQELVWDFLQTYLTSNKEYEIRFAVVMLLSFFVNEKYLAPVLATLDKLRTNDYYAKMGIAWAVSICCINFPDRTYEYFKHSKLEDWIFNKAIQKCIESYKVTPEMKAQLKTMKR